MPFSVVTVNDESELATALTAVVTTFKSEDQLDVALEAATAIHSVVIKGLGFFTLIDNPQITNVSLLVLAKGARFTFIIEN